MSRHHELLAHLTRSANESSIRTHGLLAKQEHSTYGNVVYFHRLGLKYSHTLDYLTRYARVSDLIVVVVDPELLDKSKLMKLRGEEAVYFDDVPPELLEIYK